MILIGVDQGTTGTRTVAFDERLEPVAEAYRRVAVTHPQPGWISKDAREVVRSVSETVAEVVAAVGGAERVDAIGLDNEGETVVAWDPATGEPLADAVVWGCRRSQPIVERLAAHGELVERRSGLPLDPYFTSTKIRWLIENAPGVDEDTRFGTLDAYVTLRLGDGARTDPSTAARTQLQALAAPGTWDAELCGIFGVDPGSLPAIGPSTGDLGTLCGLPLRGALVDQTAALAGHGCLQPGTVKATYGTGIFVLQNAGISPPHDLAGVLPVVAWEHDGATTYALDGGVFSAGTVIEWLGKDGLGLFADPAETEVLASSVADTAGVAFLPALAGLGAPWWRSDARGVFAGLDGGSHAGAPRARGARRALLPRPRRGRGDVRDGRPAHRAAGRRRPDGERLPAAAPGRRARHPGRRLPPGRDDGDGCRGDGRRRRRPPLARRRGAGRGRRPGGRAGRRCDGRLRALACLRRACGRADDVAA